MKELKEELIKEGYVFFPLKNVAKIRLNDINLKYGADKEIPDGATVYVEGPVSPTMPGLLTVYLLEPARFVPHSCMKCGCDRTKKMFGKVVCKECGFPENRNFYDRETPMSISVGNLKPYRAA